MMTRIRYTIGDYIGSEEIFSGYLVTDAKDHPRPMYPDGEPTRFCEVHEQEPLGSHEFGFTPYVLEDSDIAVCQSAFVREMLSCMGISWTESNDGIEILNAE